MELQKINFQATTSLRLSNSFGTLKKENDVLLECTLGIKDANYGWFEIYDEETGGESWYAEGGLDFNGMDVVGYDGCFDIPKPIADKLVEIGYSLDEL